MPIFDTGKPVANFFTLRQKCWGNARNGQMNAVDLADDGPTSRYAHGLDRAFEILNRAATERHFKNDERSL
jgi:hypothetical protein